MVTGRYTAQRAQQQAGGLQQFRVRRNMGDRAPRRRSRSGVRVQINNGAAGRHLVPRDHLKPLPAIELDGPLSGCPCADEKRSCRLGTEVVQQPATDAAPAMCGSDIGVTDQRHVLDILQTHHADQPAVLFETQNLIAVGWGGTSARGTGDGRAGPAQRAGRQAMWPTGPTNRGTEPVSLSYGASRGSTGMVRFVAGGVRRDIGRCWRTGGTCSSSAAGSSGPFGSHPMTSERWEAAGVLVGRAAP
jgi:hypothetical protein